MIYFGNLAVCLIFLPLQFLVVPILLLTSWDGRTTPFGNRAYGRGNTHPSHATKGFWQEFVWLTYRNPINNLLSELAVLYHYPVAIVGNTNIGDKIAGGFYRVKMGYAWEIYWIQPYFKKWCIRVRLGWKIAGKYPGQLCPLVFMIRPIMHYSGK